MNPLTQFKKILILPLLIVLASAADIWGESANPILKAGSSVEEENQGMLQESDHHHLNQVLDWNQIFVDTLIATNTPNSSSQRLGAIGKLSRMLRAGRQEREVSRKIMREASDLGQRNASDGNAVISFAIRRHKRCR